jgi:hypothetical protein
MKMKKVATFLIVGYFLLPSVCLADKIQGHACYTYGDNESLVQAEHTAKMLAVRNAIESNTIFIESTSQISDFQLTQDLLKSVSAGQVREVKVLKRLQSGRTICYTIEGIVDAIEIQTAIKDYLSKKSSDVRLQDNGWIRIVGQFVEEKTDKQIDEEVDEQIKRESGTRISRPREFTGRITRFLNIKIQFLRPCLATTREPELKREVEQSFKTGEPMSLESQAYLNFKMTLLRLKDHPIKEQDKYHEAREVFRKFCSEHGIDDHELFWDIALPKFRCDYRIKVFATFFSSKGYEMETVGEIPYALLTDSFSQARKTEMLPGENSFVTFVIPESAASWKVWVPK